jgi:MFS superfamily sulfate permease-like transporter
MQENVKRKIILVLIFTTIVSGFIDIAYGVYFGVLTNVLINSFWNSKLFSEKRKTKRELIVERHFNK